jgi:hypothetical protein
VGLTPEHSVDVARTGPFLMREDIDAEFLLSPLNELDVRQHTVRLEPARKLGWRPPAFSSDAGRVIHQTETHRLWSR